MLFLRNRSNKIIHCWCAFHVLWSVVSLFMIARFVRQRQSNKASAQNCCYKKLSSVIVSKPFLMWPSVKELTELPRGPHCNDGRLLILCKVKSKVKLYIAPVKPIPEGDGVISGAWWR